MLRPRAALGPAAVFVGVNTLMVLAIATHPAMAFGLLAVGVIAPFALMAYRRPQRGILALVALAPFAGALNIVPHPGVANAWKEVLVLLTLTATFVCPAAARGPADRRLPRWLPGVAGLAAAALLAAGPGDPLRTALGMKVTFFYALAAWCVWRSPFSLRERDLLVTILMITGVVEAIFGVLEQVAGPARMHQLGFEYNTTIRFSGSFFRSFGTFVQPFGLGFYLMAVVLVCTPSALSDMRRPRNIAFLALLPLLGLGIAATVVRGAVLGIGIGIGYLGVRRHRILLLAFPIGVVGLLLLPPEVSKATLSSTSTGQRATGWRQNLDVIVSHPIGKGPGTSSAAADTLAKFERTAPKNAYQPDNFYYHIAYEEGVVGLWFLCLLLAAAFLTARSSSLHGTATSTVMAEGTAAFLVASMGACLVASLFEIFPMDVLFWVLLAIESSPATQGAEPELVGQELQSSRYGAD